jgi:glucose-1-phosphate adenylyltransferase
LISGGAFIEGNVENSVIFPGVHVGKGTKIINSIIMPFSSIGENSVVEKAIIAQNCEITDNCHICSEDGSIVVIAEGKLVMAPDEENKQVG